MLNNGILFPTSELAVSGSTGFSQSVKQTPRQAFLSYPYLRKSKSTSHSFYMKISDKKIDAITKMYIYFFNT